jgi:peptide/nickel transport system substrate-binding protein
VLVAIACLVALVASACGSSSNNSGENTSGTAPALGSDVTLASDGPPQSGGNLIYGVEAESDGYNPWHNRFAPSGTEIALTIYDPLAAFDVDHNTQPYLAESMTPSADNKTWTIKARSGITFHNGQPLNGEAMRIFFEKLRADALVGIAFKPIDTVSVDPNDPLAVVLTMKTPWATFPVFLTGQGGMVTAPSMADDPDNAGRNPVGTGPFKFVSWDPDKAFKAERNPDYWRKDQNGVQLPYLNSVEFRPIPDFTVRNQSLEAGDVQMIHITDSRSIQTFQDEAAQGKFQIVLDRGEREEGFIMLNVTKAPLDDLRVRQALAYATDRNLINQVVNEGQREIGDGIFTRGSPWRVDVPACQTDPSSGCYPDYDPAKAKELVDEYEAEKGPISFELANSGTDDRVINLLKEQWAAVGIDVNITLVEQSQYIANAATGNFQAYDWRQFGGLDPDYDYIWWTSENAGEGIALNFARNKDPQIDAALQQGRSSTDLQTRKDAYATVQRKINDDLPYIWYDRAQWAVVAQNNVRGITNGPLPDGSEANPMGGPGGFGGITFLTQTWLAS